jgi:acyl-CoA thioesterase-1
MRTLLRVWLGLWLLAGLAFGKGPALEAANDEQPDLPHVLVIGDSVCQGYVPALGADLNGLAVVYSVRKLAGSSTYSLPRIEGWLAEQKWDVIQFNWGLQDTADATPAAYEKNLQELVPKLKATGARLIWATTTPSPFADVAVYNAIAARIMKENGIPVDDLYAAIEPHVAEYRLPQNVHYTEQGYALLARQAAESLLPLLYGK